MGLIVEIPLVMVLLAIAAGIWKIVRLLEAVTRRPATEEEQWIAAYYGVLNGAVDQKTGTLPISISPVSIRKRPKKRGATASGYASSGSRAEVFISYSHCDEVWRGRLEKFLSPLIHNQALQVWSDKRIKPGEIWQDEISKALARAKVAVLLVTSDFLASDFIRNNALPPLLNAARNEGLTIVWIPVSDSLYSATEIGRYQAAWDPAKPLDILPKGKRNQALREIAGVIKNAAS